MKFFGIVADTLGDELGNIQRIGFRETQVFPTNNFDELSENIVKAFIKSDNPFFEALNAKIQDVQLFPVIFRHGKNKFQITLGPMEKVQLQQMWGPSEDLPDNALYLDVDYYSIQPDRTSDLKLLVADFINKAREIDSKVHVGITDAVLNKS